MNLTLYKLLPRKQLSRLMYWAARIERPLWLKNAIIKSYMVITGANTSFSTEKKYQNYPHLNAFFTRELALGVRSIDQTATHLTSPVDGRCAQFGQIDDQTMLQAKDVSYSLQTLLGNETLAKLFQHGQTATLYLAPDDYHRIHMPCAGTLQSMHFYPGDKHSVSLTLLAKLPNIFANNERAVCIFDTDFGPMAIVLVGALNVSSIETVWHGEIIDNGNNRYQYPRNQFRFEKGQEIGRFNLGSTVIIIMNNNSLQWHENTLLSDKKIQMGQMIATIKQEVNNAGR